jgi:hypothetical protein
LNERKRNLNEKNELKKKFNPSPFILSFFFDSSVPYTKNDFHQEQFENDSVLFIIKELMPLTFILKHHF